MKKTPWQHGYADGLIDRTTRLVRDPRTEAEREYTRGHTYGVCWKCTLDKTTPPGGFPEGWRWKYAEHAKPKGEVAANGDVTITFNPSAGVSLIVGEFRVLPCSLCGDVYEFPLDGPCVVAFECDPCRQASLDLHDDEMVHT